MEDEEKRRSEVASSTAAAITEATAIASTQVVHVPDEIVPAETPATITTDSAEKRIGNSNIAEEASASGTTVQNPDPPAQPKNEVKRKNSELPIELDPDSVDKSVMKLTLLFISTLKVEYKIDQEYLLRHGKISAINTESPLLPQTVKVEELKQWVCEDWQDEWGTQPSSSSYVRLIHLGKVLDDGNNLEHFNITPFTRHTVVHCSVKPASFEIETSNKSKRPFARSRRSNNAPNNSSTNQNQQSGGHDRRCCIIS